MSLQHTAELKAGERFAFGENWSHFLTTLNDQRIALAEKSLKGMLGVTDLKGKRFLDIGSGSGLSSLVARRLGATVSSFDYDPQSVACTQELRTRYFANDPDWIVEQGSALDASYLNNLGQFDVVYSWGVLHHTGQMYPALTNVVPLVKENGQLFIAIYNDQGMTSRYWTWVKKAYNKNALSRVILIALHTPYLFALRWLIRKVTGRLTLERGMSLWHDMIDWLGGYPFEVAKPEEILEFFVARGFALEKLKTCGGRMGCNEFVFRRTHTKP
jgi:2-polyprenyl-3-methyl-5-hydroxy-6-metoxy-1,4-benzoquinol methylase